MNNDAGAVIDRTRRWIASIVIGLNLCPFAQRVFQAERIRYVASDASDAESLRAVLAEELNSLNAADIADIETTIVIHPRVLVRFFDYTDFLADADRLVKSLGLRGVIQIASFHPEFQFANTEPDAVENFTNRSPYPMLHLLREESVTRLAIKRQDLDEIPRRNVETLRAIGQVGIRKILNEIR